MLDFETWLFIIGFLPVVLIVVFIEVIMRVLFVILPGEKKDE